MALVDWRSTAAHMQQQRPPSPSFTNPDMILPFERPSRESTPTPTLGTSIGPAPTAANGTRPSLDISQSAGSRPIMPGEWQTDTSIQTTTAQDAGQTVESGRANGSEATSFAAGNRASRSLDNSASSPLQADDGGRTSPASSGSSERDPFSQLAFLKAEEILANAKKRLTTMENNLTRARSISHARSPSTASNTSPTQRFSKGNNWAISAAKLRQTGFTGSAANGGHSRVFSETSLPSRPTFGAGSQDSERLRSSSAMGSKEVDSDTQPNIRGFETRGTRYLEPLHEDDCAPSQADESALRESPPYGESSSSRLSNVDSLASKARSTVQLRDLREQMADLHNKIHSLKHRTREDSLHRRSVQRLKSPNPFTDADIYGSSGSSTPRAGTSADRLQVEPPSSNGRASRESTIIDDASQATSPDPANKMTPMTDNGSETFSKEENRDEHRIPLSEVVLPKPSFMRESKFDPDSPHSQRAELVSADGSNNVLEDEKESPDSDPSVANQDSTSERDLSESPHTSISETDDVQHATPAAPQVISNEDRPDAFDYETFVLNSTMGSFSRQGVRSSTSSASSTSTIGPGEHDEYQHRSFLDAHSQVSLSSSPPRASSSRHRLHQRQDSTDSVSTVATFATATSGDEPSLGNGTSSSYRTASRSASRGALHQSHSSSYLANNSLGFRTPSVASTRLASTIHRPSSSFPAGLSHSNGLNINGLNMHGAKTTRPKQNSTSPTNETSVATRNLILDALFSDAEREGHGATSGPMLAIGPADEALVRSVIDSLQLVCRRLASGEETTEEPVIRMRLEAAATILRSGSGDSG